MGKVKECEECSGEGTIECNGECTSCGYSCEQQVECPECDGTGIMEDEE